MSIRELVSHAANSRGFYWWLVAALSVALPGAVTERVFAIMRWMAGHRFVACGLGEGRSRCVGRGRKSVSRSGHLRLRQLLDKGSRTRDPLRMQSLDGYRRRLLDRRAELLAEGDVAIEPSRKDETAVGSDDDDMALSEMNQVIASKRNQARTLELAKITVALKRLEEAPADFGLCAECGDPIGKRLEAHPYVEYCLECQSERDGARQKGPRRHAGDFR